MARNPPARLLHQSITHSPSSIPDTYIYSILPALSNTSLAVLTSSDELLILDKSTLRNQGGSQAGVPSGATTLASIDGEAGEGNLVACAGRDGTVGVWDLRLGGRERVASFDMGEYS